jgi:hypothetical protein
MIAHSVPTFKGLMSALSRQHCPVDTAPCFKVWQSAEAVGVKLSPKVAPIARCSARSYIRELPGGRSAANQGSPLRPFSEGSGHSLRYSWSRSSGIVHSSTPIT